MATAMKRDFRCRSTKTEFENVMRASYRSNGDISQSGSDRNFEVRVSKGSSSCKEFKNLGGRVQLGVTSCDITRSLQSRCRIPLSASASSTCRRRELVKLK